MTSDTSIQQQYTFNYKARERKLIDYARSKGYKEVSDFDLYNFECKAIRSLSFNILENLVGRDSTLEDMGRKTRIVRNRTRDNHLPESIERFLISLEGRVIELGEFALKMFDFENQDIYFKVNCFSDLPRNIKEYEMIFDYSIRKTGQKGDVHVYCEEESV